MAGNKRTSTGKDRAPNFSVFTFLIPCNEGKNAYVFDVASSRNPNLPVNSSAFRDAIAANVAAGHGDKLRAELTALATRLPTQGWGEVLAGLERDGIL